MLQCVIRKLQNIAFYEQNKIHTSFRLLLYLSYICRCLSNNFLLYGPLLFFSILIYQILCKYPYCTLYTRTLHLLTSQFNSNGHCSFFFFYQLPIFTYTSVIPFLSYDNHTFVSDYCLFENLLLHMHVQCALLKW